MPSVLNARNICVCVCARARVFEWVWESTCLCMRYSEILTWVWNVITFSCVFCFHFLKWSIIALQYSFSFYSTRWISSTYVYPLLVSSLVFFFPLLVWNTLLFPLPTVPLNSASSRKPSLTPFIILSSLLCASLSWCAHHTMLHVIYSSACLSWL